jgi:hypothetical protein
MKWFSILLFLLAFVCYVVYVAIYARLKVLGVTSNLVTGWGLSGACLGVVVSAVGVIIMLIHALHRFQIVRILLAFFISIAVWLTGGGVSFLANAINTGSTGVTTGTDSGYIMNLIKTALSFGVAGSAFAILAYIISVIEKKEKNAGGESGDRKSTRALGVFECLFALVLFCVALGLAATSRHDLGVGSNIPYAVALSGDAASIVGWFLAAVFVAVGIWQASKVGKFVRPIILFLWLSGLWLVGFYCGLTSATIWDLGSRYKAEFAFHVAASGIAMFGVIIVSALVRHTHRDHRADGDVVVNH